MFFLLCCGLTEFNAKDVASTKIFTNITFLVAVAMPLSPRFKKVNKKGEKGWETRKDEKKLKNKQDIKSLTKYKTFLFSRVAGRGA